MDFCPKSGKTTERGYGDNQKRRPNPPDVHFDLEQVISPIPKIKSLGFRKELSRIECSLGSENILGALQALSQLILTLTLQLSDNGLPCLQMKAFLI